MNEGATLQVRPDIDLSPFSELYPFKSNFLSFSSTLSGVTLDRPIKYHYVDAGPRNAAPLLMLHGNPTWSFYYRNLLQGLREHYRCIAPDHIGCGLSDKPQAYPYALQQHIANLESLVERLELKNITLVLHDWGGAIGMGMAARHSQRIKRLVVLNTSAFASSRIPLRISLCRLPLFGALAIRGFNAFARAALVMAVERSLPPRVQAGLLAPYNSWSNRIALLRFVQDIPMSPRHPSWATLKAVEAGLLQFQDRPMLLCWGLKDWCFDQSFLQGWQARFPKAEVHKYENAGHYVLEDAHEQIVPAVREFLKRTDA